MSNSVSVRDGCDQITALQQGQKYPHPSVSTDASSDTVNKGPLKQPHILDKAQDYNHKASALPSSVNDKSLYVAAHFGIQQQRNKIHVEMVDYWTFSRVFPTAYFAVEIADYKSLIAPFVQISARLPRTTINKADGHASFDFIAKQLTQISATLGARYFLPQIDGWIPHISCGVGMTRYRHNLLLGQSDHLPQKEIAEIRANRPFIQMGFGYHIQKDDIIYGFDCAYILAIAVKKSSFLLDDGQRIGDEQLTTKFFASGLGVALKIGYVF